MAGCNIGCQVFVRQVHKAAIYVHCSAHNLNLAVAKSSTVPEVLSAMDVISDVHDFFKNHHYVKQVNSSGARILSNKLFKFLATAVRGILDTGRKRSVRAVCNTRWVESHTACIDFCTLFECIATGLSDCYLHCEQVAARAKSLELLKKVADPDFVFTVVLLARCNAVLRCLSKELQKEDTDLSLVSDCLMLVAHSILTYFVAASERSFSAMKRLKNYLRSTMTEQRLTGLALAHSHKDVPVSTESVLEHMEGRKRRRYMPTPQPTKKARISFVHDVDAETLQESNNDAFLYISDDSDEE